MNDRIPLLVLGLGNLICGDDGLGIVGAARFARRYRVGEGVRIVDGGTLGLSLLPYLEDAETAILVDAVRADGVPPGTLVRLEGDDVAPAVRHRLSPHQIGVSDLLDGARLRAHYPARVILLGLVPQTIGLGVERSAAVDAALPTLVEHIAAEVRQLGHACRCIHANESTNTASPLGLERHVDRILGL